MAGKRRTGAKWPPERLAPVPARWRRAVQAAWLLCFAVALIVEGGGLWRGFVQARRIDPAIASVGLVSSSDDEDRLLYAPATRAAQRLGVVAGSTLVAVDGRRVGRRLNDEEAIAALFERAGPRVAVTLRRPDGRLARFVLPHGEGVRAEAQGPLSPLLAYAVLTGFSLVGWAALIGAAVLLMRRRRDDPVSLLLSFAMLSASCALPQPLIFYGWLEWDWAFGVVPSIWLGLLIAALPAFPDGRFVPRWGGWLAVAAPAITLFIMLEDWLGDITSFVGLAAIIAAVAAPVLRFRRTPPGLERQQLKWAASGFAGSIAMLCGALLAFTASGEGLLGGRAEAWLQLAALGLFNLSFFLLPMGVLVSLLRYRLWDADAAIGRSTGFALVTLVVGGAWAAATTVLDDLISGTLGDVGKPFVAAVGTIVAALVLGPTNARINAWVERRFQGNVLKLRALPRQLQVWQHGDTPEDIGGRVVRSVVEALHATRAAMLLHAPDGYRLVGAAGVEPDAVARWIAACGGAGALAVDSLDRRDPLFPVRYVLDDAGAPIGALLLGPRSDGSIYPRDEREALSGIEVPLAAALRQAQRRLGRDAQMRTLLQRLETRIAGLERNQRAVVH